MIRFLKKTQNLSANDEFSAEKNEVLRKKFKIPSKNSEI